ncbi:TetR/AcrR family transcriptional regulator [uncultured Jatrophihabitans sp.]|uniref:TetR/AcrR family transcriptional regulator n=1 Tax=uncultured Jatrophihabitans sp. TaxID=1610747 RepID=UPI0035CBC83F
MKERSYDMRSRADSTAATGDRILAAAGVRFVDQAYDEVRLEDVAADAGVTVQTVLRRFGSKEGLVRAIVGLRQSDVVSARDSAPAGDVPAAIANLVDHYELEGPTALQLLRQELRVPIFAEITAFGRAYHRAWVARVFRPWLMRVAGRDRARLHAQLVAVCDVYTWHLLREQAGLSKAQTERAIRELVEGVLP